MSADQTFEQFFGSETREGVVNLEREERSLAWLIYEIADRSIRDDFGSDSDPEDDSDNEPNDDNNYDKDDEFHEKIKTAKENFERVVELFKLSSDAKKEFLENFDNWSSLREETIRCLKEIAEEIKSDKVNCDIAKVTGSVAGIVGGVVTGLSLLTPLAPIMLPLAIGGGITTALGSVTVVGATGTEIYLLKDMLEKAKTVVTEDEKNFSKMKKWFTHSQELKTKLETFINLDLLNDMSKDFEKFQDEAKDTLDDLKEDFRDLLARCIGKMKKNSKIVEIFGVVLAPIVMVFVSVVCLVRDHNRLALNCILQVDRIVVGMMSGIGIAFQTGRLAVELATKGAAVVGRVASAVTTAAFVTVGAAIDVINLVISSIDIYEGTEPELAKKIKEIAENLKDEFKFISIIHESLEKWKCIDFASVDNWKTFIIYNVPKDAVSIDIKKAIKPLLPEEAWGCIKLRIEGNDWYFKVPASYSDGILRKSSLIVKGQHCQVTKFNQWKTFIIHHVPDHAVQEDIKMAFTSHLDEEARGYIHLQRLSTNGNNWLVKVPMKYSQNLAQQSHIFIRRERCLIAQ